MLGDGASSDDGHLRHYLRHGISPVRYDLRSLDAHFERRDALYRSLGLPPMAFAGRDVLEVAPGSGQNSLYVATRQPRRLVLVEPNPVAQADIAAAYDALERPHTAPSLEAVRFQDFRPDDRFDIALCENWLGSQPDDLASLRRLAGLVRPGGIAVATCVPFAGFFPNVMRKLIALRLLRASDDFEIATQRMLAAFSPHLSTIQGMTRSHRDWVQDCMLNPHYLRVVLPLETLLDAFGPDMEALGTSPRFAVDWRWFKTLTGMARQYDAHLIAAERRNLHNLVDHRQLFAERSAEDNRRLATLFEAAHAAALDWEAAHDRGDSDGMARETMALATLLTGLSDEFLRIEPTLAAAFAELKSLWSLPDITPEMVGSMRPFAAVFGRETIHVSSTRRLERGDVSAPG